MKRLAAIVFAALLLSFMVCGCKKTETDPSGRVPRTDGGQSGVPADFWYGKELRICTASDTAAAQDLFAQENDAMQGEPIYDAVRKREKILRTEYGRLLCTSSTAAAPRLLMLSPVSSSMTSPLSISSARQSV